MRPCPTSRRERRPSWRAQNRERRPLHAPPSSSTRRQGARRAQPVARPLLVGWRIARHPAPACPASSNAGQVRVDRQPEIGTGHRIAERRQVRGGDQRIDRAGVGRVAITASVAVAEAPGTGSVVGWSHHRAPGLGQRRFRAVGRRRQEIGEPIGRFRMGQAARVRGDEVVERRRPWPRSIPVSCRRDGHSPGAWRRPDRHGTRRGRHPAARPSGCQGRRHRSGSAHCGPRGRIPGRPSCRPSTNVSSPAPP